MNALKGTQVAILTGMVAGFATLIGKRLLRLRTTSFRKRRSRTPIRAHRPKGGSSTGRRSTQEAIPYLEFAAQRGFKQAQVRLGEIYTNPALAVLNLDLVQGDRLARSRGIRGKRSTEIRRLYKERPREHPGSNTTRPSRKDRRSSTRATSTDQRYPRRLRDGGSRRNARQDDALSLPGREPLPWDQPQLG